MPVITPPDAEVFQPANFFTGYPKGELVGGVGHLAVTYKLTSAQLLALPGTIVQLVPAPGLAPKGLGSSIVLIPTRLVLQYLFNTTAYTLGNADNKFQIEYTGKSTALIQAACAGTVDQIVNEYITAGAIAAGILAQTAVANLGLEVTLVGTAPALTLGDGTVVLTLMYDVVVLQ